VFFSEHSVEHEKVHKITIGAHAKSDRRANLLLKSSDVGQTVA